MTSWTEDLRQVAQDLNSARSSAFQKAFRERQEVCSVNTKQESCNQHSEKDQCTWSEETQKCVAGSVQMCEKLSEQSCSDRVDCRWYTPDSRCYLTAVHDIMMQNFETETTSVPLNR